MRNSRLKLPGDFVNFSRRKEFCNIRETEEENKRFFIRSITPIIRQFMFIPSFLLRLFLLIIKQFHEHDLLFSIHHYSLQNNKMNFWNKIYIYINSFVKYLLFLIKNFNTRLKISKQILLYFNVSHNFESVNFEVRTHTPRFFYYYHAKNPPLHERKIPLFPDLDFQQIKLKSHSIRRLPDPREKSSRSL